ncbi:SDR family NAD(P)-dependent oxidoreductase [Nakamurella antarctica]|uniref:SDR family NAD(P)-dependent oxidoreductase n=1 Tax=Nakamurella antarctica TaxID=1902245 RepID=A0A3G8ZYH0_9ACTN|nr:SDR family NAD(P)-dependent oxidoreductase [Nakamurella antarctica]AZI59076.1 SDR family NAD(P)-dependent oxidoreductase [Nakamurella antarctica]
MTKFSLTGARVWVTGASSGIGAALANELTDRGALVAISARRTTELEAVSAGRMAVVPVDVSDTAAVAQAAVKVREALGGIDLVILNAGTWQQMKLDTLDAAAFARHLDVNVMGTVNTLAAVMPEMLAARSGTVAIVASVSGFRGLPGGMAYAASKAALINLAETVRAEAIGRRVRVVTINPGFVRTPMTAENKFPMPFLVDVDDAARTIADGLATRKQEIIFPLPMAIVMKTARLLPVRVWTLISRRLAGK